MLEKSYPYYLGSVAQAPNQDLEVRDKYDGSLATRVALADAAAIEKAIGLAAAAAEPMRRLPAYERQRAHRLGRRRGQLDPALDRCGVGERDARRERAAVLVAHLEILVRRLRDAPQVIGIGLLEHVPR